jgi:hypothetical protein
MKDLRRDVENNYVILKKGVKNNTMSIQDIDTISRHLIDVLSILTQRGVTQINEKESVDRYKERVWNIIENAGLLPEL